MSDPTRDKISLALRCHGAVSEAMSPHEIEDLEEVADGLG